MILYLNQPIKLLNPNKTIEAKDLDLATYQERIQKVKKSSKRRTEITVRVTSQENESLLYLAEILYKNPENILKISMKLLLETLDLKPNKPIKPRHRHKD